MAKLTKGSEQLELSLSGHPDFANALAAVKAVPGRRYDGDRKLWCFPNEPAVAERLMVTVKPEVSAEVLSWVKATKAERAQELVTPLPQDADLMLPWGNSRVHWQPEKVGKPGEEVAFNGLYGYQRSFIDVAAGKADQPTRALLLGDDMGLGKCGQSAGAVFEFLMRKSAFASNLDMPVEAFETAEDMLAWAGVENGPKLVIAPNSVKGTWRRELRMWLGSSVPQVVVDGATPKKRNAQMLEGIESNAWTIINWEQLRVKREKQKVRKKIVHPLTGDFIKWREIEQEVEVMREPLLEDTPWVAAIADEAHRAKNRKSLTTKGLWRVDATMKLALTGTPLQNSPDELWSILKWLYPKEYTAYWRFFDQYVDFYEGQYGKIITGVKNSDALRFELSTRLVRRTKKEVLKDLPDKTREYVPVDLHKPQRKLYDEAEKQMWFEVEQAIKEGDKQAKTFAEQALRNQTYQVVNGAARTVRLRQIASSPALLGGEDVSAKLDAAEELITDAGKQIVVFTEFVETTRLLVERLRKRGLVAEQFVGGISSEQRTQYEDDFQNGDIDVIVGTIPAMKEGITLTAADTVLFIERHWTPAVNEQCEDRLHRVGQKKNVTVLILEAEDTVDTQKVSVTNAIKSLIVSSVINKDDVEEKTRSKMNV